MSEKTSIGKIEFVLTNPDDLSPDALNYLSISLQKTPGNDLTLWQILEQARNGQGSIFTIFDDKKTIGAFYIQLFPNLLSIVLLAGDNISNWKDDLTKFLYEIARQHGIKNGIVIGRAGWHKIFKNMKPIGMIYTIE